VLSVYRYCAQELLWNLSSEISSLAILLYLWLDALRENVPDISEIVRMRLALHRDEVIRG
jgi:hypothetical protein